MANMTSAQVIAHQAKFGPKAPASSGGASREEILREQIMAYCAKQWPRWLVISARTDVASTIAVGAHDCTIFAPMKIFCMELKRANGKLSEAQTAWAFEMSRLGHQVFVVRSMDEFMAIVTLEKLADETTG